MNRAERTRYDVPTVVLPLYNIKAKYRSFLAVPMRLRPKEVQTVDEFAEFYRIKPSLLRQWEMEPNFWDEVGNEAKAVVGRALSDVLDALVLRAKDGSVQAIKLALEFLGVHHDKMEVQHTRDQDQVILVLPPGMQLPQLPQYGAAPSGEAEGELSQTHIDDDMDFVIVQPNEPAKKGSAAIRVDAFDE